MYTVPLTTKYIITFNYVTVFLTTKYILTFI